MYTYKFSGAISINIPFAKLITDASGVSWYFWSRAKSLRPLTTSAGPSRMAIKGTKTFMFPMQRVSEIYHKIIFDNTTRTYIVAFYYGNR